MSDEDAGVPVVEREALAFLGRYADALGRGDLRGIAECYGYPALVLGDQGTVPVLTSAAVEAAFSGAAEAQRRRGLVAMEFELVGLTQLSWTLWSADVAWLYRDDADVIVEEAAYRYVLRRPAPNGTPFAIHVVIDVSAAARG